MRPPILALALLALACDRPVPPRPDPAPVAAAMSADAAPEPAVVPRGCEINLSGRYRLQRKPSLRYLVTDDGEHLLARPLDALDGGDPAAMAMVLDRTPRGFVGKIVGYARTAAGALCPVTFAAELIACGPEGLTVRSEDSVSVDEQCRVRRLEGSATEKVLVRE